VDLEELKDSEKKKKTERRQEDLVLFLVLMAVCIGWLVLTMRIPHWGKLTWPGMLPMILLIGIILMIGPTLISIYLPNPEYRNLGSLFRRILLPLKNLRGPFYRGALTTTILLVYFLLLRYLPYLLPPTYSYLIVTPLFIIALIAAFRAASVWITLLVAALSTIGLYLIFGMFYAVPLP
jgi:hypothetical protein